MYKLKKDMLLQEVLDCLKTGRELIVYNYGDITKVEAFREGMVPNFLGWREVLYSYKFDIADDPDSITEEDAIWALDKFLIEELKLNDIEVIQ